MVFVFIALCCQVAAVFFLNLANEKKHYLSFPAILAMFLSLGSLGLFTQFYGLLAGVIISVASYMLVGITFVLINGSLLKKHV
jgi:membrane-bound ClpP family serine protease